MLLIADLLKVTRIEKRDLWVYLSNVLLNIDTFTYFISCTFLVNFVLYLSSPGTRVTKIKRKREHILFFFKVNEWRIPEKKQTKKWIHKKCTYIHRRTGNFLSGGAVNHLPKKNSRKLPKFLRNSRKETRAIRCNNVGHTGTEGGSMLWQFFRVNTSQFWE